MPLAMSAATSRHDQCNFAKCKASPPTQANGKATNSHDGPPKLSTSKPHNPNQLNNRSHGEHATAMLDHHNSGAHAKEALQRGHHQQRHRTGHEARKNTIEAQGQTPAPSSQANTERRRSGHPTRWESAPTKNTRDQTYNRASPCQRQGPRQQDSHCGGMGARGQGQDRGTDGGARVVTGDTRAEADLAQSPGGTARDNI